MAVSIGGTSARARVACAVCVLFAAAGVLAAPASAARGGRAHASLVCQPARPRHHRGHAARHHHHRRHHRRGHQARSRRARCSVRSLRRAHDRGALHRTQQPQQPAANLAALATLSCPDTTLQPAPSNIERVRASVFCLINRERARNGEAPLRPDTQLRSSAQFHSDDMVAREYFDHEAPDGETLLDRLRSSGYLYSSRIGYVVGENIAWGTLSLATPKAIVEAWMASPGHRANILDASFRDTGIGVSSSVPQSLGEGQPGAMYTQDFGVVIPG